MDWYYATNGQQQGPVSQDELIELLQTGKVQASDLVWNDSMSDWVPLSSLPELAGTTAAGGPAGTSAPSVAVPSSVATPSATTNPVSGEQPPTYLWQSIVCLVCCCLPAAIPALIYSTKVEPAWQQGDPASAKDASAKAKMWCWIAFAAGIIVNTIAFLVFFSLGLASEM